MPRMAELRDPPAHLDVFRALSHPARRVLVERLCEGEAFVEDLVDLLFIRFHLMTSSTSKHLRVLREAGIVASTVRAQHRVYALRPDGLDDLSRWVDAVNGTRRAFSA